VREAIARHFKRHLIVYVPAAVPLLFFFLAHGITAIMLILIKSGVLPQNLTLHKILLTWGLYGFLPLLLCSYFCFFAVARPVIRLLGRRFPEWMPGTLTLASGVAYGMAVAVVLLLLLASGSMERVFFLLLIGMTTGLGNWVLYRMLTGVAAQAQAASPRTDL
jgi:hypothetical protein